MISRGGAIVAAVLLLTPSCRDAAHEGEIACQRRLIAVTEGRVVPRLPSGGPDLATSFAAMSRGFEQMPLEGCSEEQHGRAAIMARVTRELSNMATRIGDPARRSVDMPRPGDEAVMEFAARVEQFDLRRQVLRQNLDEMIKHGAE